MKAGDIINGWTVTSVTQTGPSGTWKVIAKCGYKIVSCERLSAKARDRFDPQIFWDAR